MRGNENDSEDVRSIYDNLKKIYKEKEELAFVLLHHMTKTNSGTLHSLRGSGDFGAMAENVINFVKQETYVSSGFKLKVTKNRHIAGNPMYEVLVVSDGATGPVTITAIGEIHRQNRTRERDKVKEAILQDCKVGDILDTSSESELMRKLIEQEFKKSTISDAIKELRDIDQIIRQKKRGEYEVIRTIKDDNVDNLSQNNLSSYTK
jgi:hypothetical protein